MTKTYKSYVLELVNQLCPFKKKAKYTHDYYYSMFLHVLKDVNSRKSLSLLTSCEGTSRYHYTTIRKMFNKWYKLDIFRIAYYRMLHDNKLHPSQADTSKDVDLFIDATFINNKTGSEMVDVNPLYYKKHVTKLCIICNTNKIPLSISPVKTTSYDGKTIIPCIKNLNIKRKVNLVGDKGYVINSNDKKSLLKKHKIKLIVPRKKNQKNVRLSKHMKSKLKIRNIVENCIQSIKTYSRVYLRRDRLISNYLGFVFIASGLILNNKII